MSVGNELPATVGAQYDRIEQLYGSRGWIAFQRLYHEAAGLRPRRKPIASTDTFSATDVMPGAPLNCDAIEPGLFLREAGE